MRALALAASLCALMMSPKPVDAVPRPGKYALEILRAAAKSSRSLHRASKLLLLAVEVKEAKGLLTKTPSPP